MSEPASRLAIYEAFDEIEAEFHAALDLSLEPRGPESIFDLVAGLGLHPGAAVVDVGCGRGDQSVELAERFGFEVLGVDPHPRHHGAADRAATLNQGSVRFIEGTLDAIPAEASSTDLLFCRESLMFGDLDASISEFRRVLRPGARGLVFLVLRGPRMTEAEAQEFWSEDSRGEFGSRGLTAADIETALGAADFVIDEHVDYGSEWGELGQEQHGASGRRLLHAARLLREPRRYIAQFGQDNYNVMLRDCYWYIYRMVGKLSGYACTFTKP